MTGAAARRPWFDWWFDQAQEPPRRASRTGSKRVDARERSPEIMFGFGKLFGSISRNSPLAPEFGRLGGYSSIIVRHHVAPFLEHVEEGSYAPLPDFVRDELRGFAVCGDFSQGFVRTACRRCGDELRVPFPCKGRGFCPSCMGRRMAEGAALLVDHVLPAVGYRQWVLSFSGPLAVRLGYDRELLAAVSGCLGRAVLRDIRRAVKREHGLASVAALHGGVVTVVQRFRSDLGLYVHLHLLVTDGAFEECTRGRRRVAGDQAEGDSVSVTRHARRRPVSSLPSRW